MVAKERECVETRERIYRKTGDDDVIAFHGREARIVLSKTKWYDVGAGWRCSRHMGVCVYDGAYAQETNHQGGVHNKSLQL